MHWSIDQLRDLHAEEFEELVEWLKDRNDKRSGDGDSVDMDKVIDAKKAKDDAG